MDIAALSTAMAQSKLSTDVGVAVLNLAKDSMTQAGEQLVNMMETMGMERSVNPNVGSKIDIRL